MRRPPITGRVDAYLLAFENWLRNQDNDGAAGFCASALDDLLARTAYDPPPVPEEPSLVPNARELEAALLDAGADKPDAPPELRRLLVNIRRALAEWDAEDDP